MEFELVGRRHVPAGTYYVWVQRLGDTAVIPAYGLGLTIL